MRNFISSQKFIPIILILSIMLIFPLAYCEYTNLESSKTNEIKLLSDFEKEILHNKLEELVQFKNKFFTRNKKCKY